MTDPVFSTVRDTRGVLIICTINGETGAARVMSAGEEEARRRAEAQARAKAQARGSAE